MSHTIEPPQPGSFSRYPCKGGRGEGSDHGGGVMRVLVAFNRSAGSSAAGEAVAEVLAGRPGVTLRYPLDAEEMRACAAEAVRDRYDVLAAGGGDGTVHTLVNALAPHFDAVRLAVLPLGTGNDLCRSLGIP